MARAIILRKAVKVEVGDLIDIDSCLDETHTMTNTVTDNPVEEGFNVTDHSRPDPDVVTLRCFVSNTPFSTDQVKTAQRSGDVDFETTAPETIEGRGKNAFDKLKKMRDDGAIISVVTTLRNYTVSSTEGMMIQNLTIPRTRQNYDGLEFSVTLKQIRIVRNRSTTDVRAKDKRARQKKKDGNKPTEPPQKKVTKLKRLYKAGGGTR